MDVITVITEKINIVLRQCCICSLIKCQCRTHDLSDGVEDQPERQRQQNMRKVWAVGEARLPCKSINVSVEEMSFQGETTFIGPDQISEMPSLPFEQRLRNVSVKYYSSLFLC